MLALVLVIALGLGLGLHGIRFESEGEDTPY